MADVTLQLTELLIKVYFSSGGKEVGFVLRKKGKTAQLILGLLRCGGFQHEGEGTERFGEGELGVEVQRHARDNLGP
ncbi:MAG: hypothetical protein DRN83_03430 [Hadesarchaea archaeon]|nr:MAG: hypothetical protein DRN83_03430 [Hadesarchaea archaeon]